MTLKDWLLLCIPIIFNGVIVFILQKIYEKKQRIRTWQSTYISNAVEKIDISLELHAKATRLANEGNASNDTAINTVIQQFFDNNLDIYYYYVMNKNIFKYIEDRFESIGVLTLKLSKEANRVEINDPMSISKIVNEIRDVLLHIKDESMKI